jgi:hypothetical protein
MAAKGDCGTRGAAANGLLGAVSDAKENGLAAPLDSLVAKGSKMPRDVLIALGGVIRGRVMLGKRHCWLGRYLTYQFLSIKQIS